MSDLESKRLDDDALEDVNGGFFFNDLVLRSMGGGRNGKLFTLEQKGDDDWTPSTLEQRRRKRKGLPPKGFGGTSKL